MPAPSSPIELTVSPAVDGRVLLEFSARDGESFAKALLAQLNGWLEAPDGAKPPILVRASLQPGWVIMSESQIEEWNRRVDNIGGRLAEISAERDKAIQAAQKWQGWLFACLAALVLMFAMRSC